MTASRSLDGRGYAASQVSRPREWCAEVRDSAHGAAEVLATAGPATKDVAASAMREVRAAAALRRRARSTPPGVPSDDC